MLFLCSNSCVLLWGCKRGDVRSQMYSIPKRDNNMVNSKNSSRHAETLVLAASCCPHTKHKLWDVCATDNQQVYFLWSYWWSQRSWIQELINTIKFPCISVMLEQENWMKLGDYIFSFLGHVDNQFSLHWTLWQTDSVQCKLNYLKLQVTKFKSKEVRANPKRQTL